jgi:lipopolysaccharide transport system ATP-binding protein
MSAHEQAPVAAAPAPAWAIETQGLWKTFRLPRRVRGHTTLKSALIGALRGRSRPTPRVEVLRGVDLRVPRGSTLGVIGANGSGKTTFLKVLAGIYRPSAGRVVVRGRVSALIELGAGFHPEFSGRENVLLNGLILGLTRRQVWERFDRIVAFAGLEDVIDHPVRTYSSGMYMRLGFAVAAHVDPEVFLIDEVLAVGDASFVPRCEARMLELQRRGTTMVLVSHDLPAVERWCDRAIWLDGGRVAAEGRPAEVTGLYQEAVSAGTAGTVGATSGGQEAAP